MAKAIVYIALFSRRLKSTAIDENLATLAIWYTTVDAVDPDFYLKYKAARNVNYPTANKKEDADAVADEPIVENAEVQ